MRRLIAATIFALFVVHPAQAITCTRPGHSTCLQYGNVSHIQISARRHVRHKRLHRNIVKETIRATAKAVTYGIRKAKGVELVGVVPRLYHKAMEIHRACGSRVYGGIRSHSYYVRGTRRMSLHKIGRAVDASGNPSCIYAHLRNWPGGVSVDYGRVRHVHFSYDPHGREWGSRFHHGGRHYAKRHKRHRRKYARK